LGVFFARFMETNRFAPFQPALKPPVELTVPELAPETAPAADSELRIEGDLARRRLLNPMVLPLQPSPNILTTDILTNSVVQVVVDAAGRVFSCTLPASSGSTNADRCALDLARNARFEPLARDGASGAANPAAGLSWGRMIFEWRTTPLPTTPAPAAAP
jgi:TonB family protein